MDGDQIIQICGAMLILSAFVLLQTGRMRPDMVLDQLLNFGGSLILAILALIDSQWGFFLLEGMWAIVSFWALARLRWFGSGGQHRAKTAQDQTYHEKCHSVLE